MYNNQQSDGHFEYRRIKARNNSIYNFVECFQVYNGGINKYSH